MRREKGFTLLEALVGISIMLLLITGVTSLVQATLQSASVFKDQLVAVMLAQEGVEFVRNQRDTNRIGSPDISRWMNNILTGSPPPCSPLSCIADMNFNTGVVTFRKCTGTACPLLTFNPATNLYGYEASAGIADSRYRRSIRVTALNADEVEVISVVEWTGRFGNHRVEVREFLKNWQQ